MNVVRQTTCCAQPNFTAQNSQLMKNPAFTATLTDSHVGTVLGALNDLLGIYRTERVIAEVKKARSEMSGVSFTVIDERPTDLEGVMLADYRSEILTLIGHKNDEISGTAFGLMILGFEDGWQSLVDMLIPTDVDVTEDPNLELGQILVDDALGMSPRGRSALTQAKFRLLQSGPDVSEKFVWKALRAKLQLEAASKEPAASAT